MHVAFTRSLTPVLLLLTLLLSPAPAGGSSTGPEPLHWPGGVASITEAVDAGIVGEALHWAATQDVARNETFNVTNGDVFTMANVWPAIAEALGVDVGEERPTRLAVEMPRRAAEWADVHDRFGLVRPREVEEFVGQSFIYTDMRCGDGNDRLRPPSLVSTITILKAGFTTCLDTAELYSQWVAHPPRAGLRPHRAR